MRVLCYFEGEDPTTKGKSWSCAPPEAAYRHAASCSPDAEEQHVIVVPLDDEARALPGWHDDDEDPAFKMFVLTPTTTWTAVEVATFNPHHAPPHPHPRWTREEELRRANAIQRDRAFVNNPMLDPEQANEHFAWFVHKHFTPIRRAMNPRWFHHTQPPAREPHVPVVVFDGPRIVERPWGLKVAGQSWNTGVCDPLGDLRRAMGHEAEILAAYRLAGEPRVTIVITTCSTVAGSTFPANPGSLVKIDGRTWGVEGRKVVQPGHGPRRLALLIAPVEHEGVLPAPGMPMLYLGSRTPPVHHVAPSP